MGDPKFPHKTYSTPRHPWQKERIDSEKEILAKFGLKNKRELWKGMEMLKSFRSQARDLQARMRTNDPSAERQFQALIQRLGRYNILGHNASLDDVLSLSIEDILSRRLQTIVFRKNLARTPKQARQMITHGHVTMNGRRVTVPGMLVESDLEETIVYHGTSPFTDDLHPIRQVIINGPTLEEKAKAQEEAAAERAESRSRGYGRDRSGRRYPQSRDRNARTGGPARTAERTPMGEKPKEAAKAAEQKLVEPKAEVQKAPEKKAEPVKEVKPKGEVKAPEPKPAEKKAEPVKETAPPKEEKPKKAEPKVAEVKTVEPKVEEEKLSKPVKEEKPKTEPKEEPVAEEKAKPKKAAKPKEQEKKEKPEAEETKKEKPKKAASKTTKSKDKEPKEAEQ